MLTYRQLTDLLALNNKLMIEAIEEQNGTRMRELMFHKVLVLTSIVELVDKLEQDLQKVV